MAQIPYELTEHSTSFDLFFSGEPLLSFAKGNYFNQAFF